MMMEYAHKSPRQKEKDNQEELYQLHHFHPPCQLYQGQFTNFTVSVNTPQSWHIFTMMLK